MKRLCLIVTILFLGLVAFAPGPSPAAARTAHANGTQQDIDQRAYAGSRRCSECHATYFDSWKDSAHNKMIRPAVSSGPNKTVLADFSKPDPLRPFELKDVRWVIGHRWKQRFIGVVDGEEVVFPGQWSIQEKRWQPYTGKSDWWYAKHPDWKTRSNFKLCAGCHSTGVDPKTQTWTEQNITCESCHGPGRLHSDNPQVDNIVNPARLSTERSMEVCLSCHQAGRPPQEGYAWPVGYQPGKRLADFWKGFQPIPGKQSAEFWENGSAHKNRVQGNTFQQSAMHTAGLQCSSCHDSHGSRHVSMTTKSASTNALCNTCHGPGKQAGPNYKSLDEHTHHDVTSAGSSCIGCHMPKTGENSVGAESRDHTFRFISPSVSMGSKMPNSCNLCHTTRSANWALEKVQVWYPRLKP